MSLLRGTLAAGLLLAAGPALAAQPIPLQAGTYCGPEDRRIVVDVAHDIVQIDDFTCMFPIIAADHMQSQYCSKPDTTTGKQIFDFRVVGRDFVHNRVWYRLCGPVPPNPTGEGATAPNAPAPAPVKTGG